MHSLARRARESIGGPFSADALHVLGLLDLVWADGGGNGLSQTISHLQQAARLSPDPAAVLADLSAAHLVRAELMHTSRDLLEAVEVAGQALEADSSNQVARYNLALALDDIGLDARATTAWESYLRLDSISTWAERARTRLRILAPNRTPSRAVHDEEEIMRLVDRTPQDVQLLGWDQVLGEWGDAVLDGDSTLAKRRLQFAQALGAALEARHRDGTLADGVRFIHTVSRDPIALRRLARAHSDYSDARGNYLALRRNVAGRVFAQVRSRAPSGSPLYQWATVFYGATETYRNPIHGEPILRRAASRADTKRHPALAGRARWLLGTTLLRQGRYREARAEYRIAALLLTRAGEYEHLGAVQAYTGSTEHQLADPAAAYQSLHAALVTLRPYRSSAWLHNALWTLADAAASDGYLRAAAQILEEDVAITETIGNPVYAAEARTARARLLVATGSASQAIENLRTGLAESLARVELQHARGWFQAELWEAEAATVLHDDPARAITLLDSTVSYWNAERNILRLLAPLVMRADALLSAGRVPQAQRDADQVLTFLASQRGSIASSPERVTLLESIRAVVGRLIMARIATSDVNGALLDLQRARASLLPVPIGGGAWHPTERLRAPHNETALVYALISDTLLIWAVRDTTVHLTRRTVDRVALLRTAEGTRSLLEHAPHRGVTSAALSGLQSLYDQLLRPVEAFLTVTSAQLLIVPDESLAAFPFAALYDARTGRYLIERHTIRLEPTLPVPHRGVTGSPASGPMLLVDGTGFDRAAFPQLNALPGARLEIETLARNDSTSVVLAGRQATRASILSVIPRASLFHFAGHAVLDDQRPEQSRLLLAPDEAAGGLGEISVTDIERMRLARGSLVVLSACQTVRSPHRPSGGFAGLAGAFLNAGAKGVIGSLWRIDDEATLHLMTAFHQEYRQRSDGPAALRSAQLRMLRSPEPRMRSPAAWAGFTYAGN